LLKTLEKLVDIHIRLTIDQSLLSDTQHAYRKGRPADTALHSLVSSIERGFRNKEYSLAAFLDIEGAFNNVTPTAITGALTELDDVVILLQGKFPQTLCNLMETALSTLSRWTAVCGLGVNRKDRTSSLYKEV